MHSDEGMSAALVCDERHARRAGHGKRPTPDISGVTG